jgi:FkbM family methyltransferase
LHPARRGYRLCFNLFHEIAESENAMKFFRRLMQVFRDEQTPVRFLVSRVLWHSGLSQYFTIRMNGFRLTFFPSSMSASYWENPESRLDDAKVLRTFLHEGDVFIDVGANVGGLSCEAATLVGKGGAVIAFEPHPRIFNYLRQNVELNAFDQVSVFNLGLGEQRAELRFTNAQADDMNAISMTDGIAVNVDTLDAVLSVRQMSSVRLMKVDVEGYELFVFRGAVKTLAKTDIVFFEAFEEQYARFGYGFADVHRCLTGLGFEIMDSVTRQPVAATHVPVTCENLLAVRKSALAGSLAA